MRYCTRCVVPDTKPYASFDDEGVCSACRAHELKNARDAGVDWDARQAEFDEIVLWAKAQLAPWYDAIVPVSGGKDSIAQVSRLLGRGLRILAVNVDYGIKTEIGRRNLARIPAMGASLVAYRPDETLNRWLIRLGLEDFGDPDLLSHTLLHAYPLHVALRFQVPLVLLGENSAFEYGGDADIAGSSHISRAWFERYAANAGRGARFVSERYGIPFEQLALYDYPDELDTSATTRAVFCGHFFHWDSEEHLRIAQGFGFESLDAPGEGTYRTFVGIDEKINRIHQYLKVLKFGYGRATDHACEDIRNGRLTREAAKELVRRYDLQPLSARYVADLAAFLEMTPAQVEEAVELYRNTAIWERAADGSWTLPGHLEG